MFGKRSDTMDFKIKSDFKPTGDQPEAIKSIVDSINRNEKFSTLLGVTGSGKHSQWQISFNKLRNLP